MGDAIGRVFAEKLIDGFTLNHFIIIGVELADIFEDHAVAPAFFGFIEGFVGAL